MAFLQESSHSQTLLQTEFQQEGEKFTLTPLFQ